ncbi:MAG: polyprenyl diphosphate synthase, partial [Acidobacteriota bacterium]
MIDLSKLAEPGSIEETLLEKIDLSRLPRHIAVIMDGNGRWAKSRHLPRVEGHRAGISSVREIVETAARLELRVITLYAFSVENWKRPRFEVATLMMLLKEYLRKELATLMENNIRFQPIGRIEGLDPTVQRELKYAQDKTAGNSGLLFQIALNYG